MNKKLLVMAGLLGSTMFVGCNQTTVDTVRKEVVNQIQKDDPHIQMVKNGHNLEYAEKTYGEAFEAYFSNPTWEYFKAETGEDIVEFTGRCIFREVEVEATIQFILDTETGNFEIGALSFNDVPQIELITAALINNVFAGDMEDSEVPEGGGVKANSYWEDKERGNDEIPEGGGVKADSYWEDKEGGYDEIPEGGGVKADSYWEDKEIIYDEIPEGGGVKADSYWEDKEGGYDEIPEGGGVKADSYWEDKEIIYDELPEGGGVKADDYWNEGN